jgi:hypothetical protein
MNVEWCKYNAKETVEGVKDDGDRLGGVFA